jgi:Zn-dependent peptidase ImmA (M78 family)
VALNLSKSEMIRIKKMKPTMRELRLVDLLRDYKVIRNAYFGNSIPPVDRISIALLPCKCKQLDDTLEDCMGYVQITGMPIYLITIGETLDVTQTRFTLIHEMAHLKVDLKHNRSMHHGKYWQTEMKRLANIGAFEHWW